LDNGDRLLTILNKGGAAADLEVSWERLGLSAKAADGKTVKNLWTGEQEKASTNGITAQSVPSHGTAVFRVSNFDGSVTPTGIIFNTFSLNCLTDDESGKVTWTNCTASDAQTWRVRDDGHINSLAQPDNCLADANGNIQSSQSACNTDTWKYETSGNLINAGSNNCLTEAENGAASGARCGYETNEQVLGLPVGVTVN
jgi:alpha-galactosidase